MKSEDFDRLIDLAKLKGTDVHFRKWVQSQPSAISGKFSEYDPITGRGRCEAAHVRRINMGSGMGIKGKYCCIPLTHKEHLRQHQHGESSLKPKDWWAKTAEEYLRRWINT